MSDGGTTIAIVAGLGAAACWTVTTMSSAEASRLIGARLTLAWVMTLGLVILLPFLATEPVSLDARSAFWLFLVGAGNVVGLLLEYAGMRIGRVGVVAPIASAEGAVAAVIAAVAGESIAPAVGGSLALIAAGVVLAAGLDPSSRPTGDVRTARFVPALFGLGAALAFGTVLFSAGQVSSTLPLAWVVLPARLVGFVFVAIPLLLTRNLRLTRAAAPFVTLSAVMEVVGFAVFTIGSAHDIAITSVLGSEFAAIAAIAAWILFRERLSRVQVAGVGAIAVGVALLAAFRG
ncbi:MAG: EamA family transporter [Chloroflexi bacterium]|nr:EamA family transporter [Chloroflexota bacterium]